MNTDDDENRTLIDSTNMLWIAIGAGIAGLAVALGAAGTHSLREYIDATYPDLETRVARITVWEVGVRYQMYHAFGLIFVGLIGSRLRTSNLIGWLMLIGTFVFSGSLYTLVLTDISIFGLIVVFGGLFQLAAWFTLMGSAFWSAWKQRSHAPS